jgi:23S rRNA (adenine2503-C2)-methyltransferase
MFDSPPMLPPISKTAKVKSRASLHDLSYTAMEEALERSGVRRCHAAALWKAMYRDRRGFAGSIGDLTPPLRHWVERAVGPDGAFCLDTPTEELVTHSSDALTQKFLLRLQDGATIETVLMRYPGRNTACVSTQAGCAMGCVFCATGQAGFSRHLRPGEIVGQVQHARRCSGDGELRNLVLMGMGEPLHNYDAVMSALEIISDTRALNIGPSRITVSTVGLVPEIRRMADEGRPYHLGISLHGANDAERAKLVPVGRRWPLTELMSACRRYIDRTGQKIFFGWTLIAGKNDSVAKAAELAALLKGLYAHVNLIPLNPTAGYPERPTNADGVRRFQDVLARAGIPSTVRQRRGIDVAAGCGQLSAVTR